MKRPKRSLRTKRTPRSTSHHAPQPDQSPSPSALAATVAWMLALMATVLAEVLGLACQLYGMLVQPGELISMLAAVMLYVASLAGLVTLVMIPVVLNVAPRPPPRVILLGAAVAGCLPWLVILLQQFA